MSIATKASIESLSQRVIRSGFWVFSLRITERAFSLIRLIILARILAPHDFGLMGIAMLTMATLETFSQTGFQAALIQKKENTELYLDAAWTIMIIRGLILFTILYFIAPYAAIFFKSPQAKPIIRIIGFSILFQAFTNIGVIYFRKELEFNKQFIYQLSGTLADFIVAISAALILRSVWALVFGLLVGNAVRCLVSYLVHPYRPHLSSDLGKAKELFGFGKWILGSSIITFLFNQGDDAFLGKVLGVTMLGFYQMAYRIGQLPATEFAKVISQVTFPAYSKLQNDRTKLQEGFFKTLNITSFIMIPLAGGIFMLAPEFTRIFLTQKWMPMVTALRILTIAGMIRALVTTGGALFQGKGVPRLDFKMNGIRLLTMATTIYPLSLFFNMNGVALAVALGNVSFIPVWLIETSKITRGSFKDFLKAILPPFLGAIVMCVSILFSKSIIIVSSLLSFISIIILAIVIFFASMYFTEKMFNIKTLDNLRLLIRSLGGS